LKETKTNIYAILSLIFSFVFFPLGLAFGVIGLYQIKRTHEHGKGLAAAGIILSSLAFIGMVLIYSAVLFAVGTVFEETAKITAPLEYVEENLPTSQAEIGMLATVNSITKQNVVGDCGEYGFSCVKAGNGKIFLVIDVTVENKGVESGYLGNYIFGGDFKIKDEDGYVYVHDPNDPGNLEQAFPYGEIQIGDKIRGKVAFEIPTSATGLKFDFRGSIVYIN